MVRTHKSRQRGETRDSQRHRRDNHHGTPVCVENEYLCWRNERGWVVAAPSMHCYHCRDKARAHKKTGIPWPVPWGFDVLAEAKKMTSPAEKRKTRLLQEGSVQAGTDETSMQEEKMKKTGARCKMSTSHGPKAEKVIISDEMIEDAHVMDADTLFYNSRWREAHNVLPEMFCTSDQKDLADLRRRGYLSEMDHCVTGGVGLEDVVRMHDGPDYSVRYVKPKSRKGPLPRKRVDRTAIDDWAYPEREWIYPEWEWDVVDDSVSDLSWVDLDEMSDLTI